MPPLSMARFLPSCCCCDHESRGGSAPDSLTWRRDSAFLGGPDFSMAVAQANALLEDQSQIQTGPLGTFVGIYDGHGGPEAAWFVADHLFPAIERCVREDGGVMSGGVIKRAFQVVEEEFAGVVERARAAKPQLATVGSCCLVGVISGDRLYVANLGDSRAVSGVYATTSATATMHARRLCKEHNASEEEVRRELQTRYPDDPEIVVLKQGVWRVKGVIQVSRSIGDVYLKDPNIGPINLRSGAPLTISHPVLTAEPSINEYTLSPQDRFLIFASDGLWEQLTDQQAVEIVHKSSRKGAAAKLVQAALQEAARKREARYSDLGKIKAGVRRFFHDDISVVVVYLDSDSGSGSDAKSKFSGLRVGGSPWHKSVASQWSKGGGGGGGPKIHAVGRFNAPQNVFPLCI